jgi:endogenous inhibitor of DNA gyrase (YacG/DUF329 family)
MNSGMKVKCPRCGKLSEYTSQNAFRPFCSERCQILDLGAWADERYRVPTEEASLQGEQDFPSVNEKSDSPSVSSEILPPKHLLN